MSVLQVIDIGGENFDLDSKKLAYFMEDFFKFCSDRMAVLANGTSCKLSILAGFMGCGAIMVLVLVCVFGIICEGFFISKKLFLEI